MIRHNNRAKSELDTYCNLRSLLKACAGICLLPVGVAGAEELVVTAASQDWVAREQLSGAHLTNLEPYCDGTYVAPAYGFEGYRVEENSTLLKAMADKASAKPESTIELWGNVELQQGEWWLEADKATLDRQTNKAWIEGNITGRAPGLAVHGTSASYNLDTADFSLENSSYVLHDRHARGEADGLSSSGTQEVVIQTGSFTTCAPDSRAWSLIASEIVLDREKGEGNAKHMRLRILDVPVMYFPYLAFPIDDRRRSGFLFPTLETSNTGRGISLGVPYYFNLAPDYDATYSPRYIHGRGLLNEVEGRWLTKDSYSELRLGYLYHDSEFLKEFPDENNGNRWALDFENRYRIADGWRSTIDYNAVGDNEYLNDLNRTLEIAETSHIKRSWDVNYGGETLSFRSRVSGYQTIDDGIAERDYPYYQLPQLTLDWNDRSEWFNYGVESEYTYFWRDNENITGIRRTNGSRWRTQPDIELDLSPVWGYFKPGIRLDHTDYLLEDEPEGNDSHISRTVPFYRIDSGLYFDRTVQMFDHDYNQSLEPRLFYVYSPESEQDDVPDFDTSVPTFSYSRLFKEDRFVGGDRVGDNNRLSAGVTTRFNDMDSGIEVFRASIGQIFYYEDGEVDLNGSGGVTESESPYAGELLWRPNQNTDIKISGLWDAQESRTEKGTSTLSFHDAEYSKLLNLSHRYSITSNNPNDHIEQTDISTLFPVTDSVSLLGRWLFDLRRHRTIGTLAGVEYSDCCWRVQLVARSYLEDEDNEESRLDHGIFLRFQLRGLGGLGTGDESALSTGLKNYNARENYRDERYQW
ncbi:LPS-assembly protein LptD [Hahella ganghwensis]|uniref:LPS-assembly protein LptD n=1 Tax=Hahella ganghwensis TaxID=286420 RepID=UPI0003A59DCB|nr:LPS-assembly protein LptD [Hahella ganghwensis]